MEFLGKITFFWGWRTKQGLSRLLLTVAALSGQLSFRHYLCVREYVFPTRRVLLNFGVEEKAVKIILVPY